MSEIPEIGSTQRAASTRAPLSHRETEVLKMMSGGLTNREIADGLAVTVHAVKFHLASIYRKLGVTNRTEAAVLYLRTSMLVEGAERS